MDVEEFRFGHAKLVNLEFEAAVQRTKDVLARHGFGVQAEIPISKALKNALGADVPREVILGVCNPRLAHRAMQIEPEITALLPCNVTVREAGSGVRIAVVDPGKLLGVVGKAELSEVGGEAEALLLSALKEI